MSFLPILQRELLSGARSRATYWTRCAIGLAGVLICMQTMSAGLLGTPATLGRYVFNAVIAAAFLVSCCACLLSADAISAERREGTLEVLFLTGARPVDVLLGKVGSVGLTSICGLVAFLPALMVPLLAGGVTAGEALRKGLALLNLLFFALMAGLCASAAQRERFRASRTAVLLVGLVVIVPFLVFVVARHTLPYYFGLLSPLSCTVVAGETYYAGASHPFWFSIVVIELLAWTLLVVAGLRLRHAVAKEGGEATDPAPSPGSAHRAVGLMSWQPTREAANPVEWLVYRRFSVGAGLWGLAILSLAYNGWVPLAEVSAGSRRGSLFAWFFAWPFAVTAGLIGGTIVAWVASRFFVGVRRSGDLELLLTTPVGAASMVGDQWSVLKRLFVWPVLVMQAPMLPQLLSLAAGPAGGIASNPAGSPLLSSLLTLVNVFLGATALCWLGLWFGLKARTQAAAIVWTVALGKGVPAMVSLVGLILGQAFSSSSGLSGSAFFSTTVQRLAEVLNLVFYVWVIWLARHRLATDLSRAEPLPFEWPQSWGQVVKLWKTLFTSAVCPPPGRT